MKTLAPAHLLTDRPTARPPDRPCPCPRTPCESDTHDDRALHWRASVAGRAPGLRARWLVDGVSVYVALWALLRDDWAT